MFWIFFCALLHADKFSYPAQNLSSTGIQNLKVSGVKGRLILRDKPQAKAFTIQVSHTRKMEDWGLSVERQGAALVLEVYNTALGPQWRQLVRAEAWPEFDVTIEGPSIPALISWREGKLEFKGWRKKVEASLMKGEVRSERGGEDWDLQVLEGRVLVRGHDGRFLLKGERGNIDLADLRGAVVVRWHEGEILADNIRGGAAEIETSSGRISLNRATGPIKISAGGAAVNVRGQAPSEIEVVTDSGPVNLKWTGGIKFFLTTKTGKVVVPKVFHVESRDGVKVVEGSLAKPPRGQVFVRTNSGAIWWQ